MKLIIETEQLQLREFNLEDAEFIFILLNSPSWIEFIGDRNIKNTKDARNYLINGPMKSYATFGFGLYLVQLKQIPR